MAKYVLNEAGFAKAWALIDARQYRVRSRWSDAQPGPDEENIFLETHTWEEYGAWHLALTEGAAEQTKARYGFVFGDFRRVRRMGLIACRFRAAEWDHKAIKLAAHDLLQHLDASRA